MVYGMLVLGIFSTVFAYPGTASASIFSGLVTASVQAATIPSVPVSPVLNSQNAPLALSSNIGPGTLSGVVTSSADDQAVGNAVLTPAMGPVGNVADAEDVADTSGGITFYTVQDGDTIVSVSKMFNITVGTLESANSISAGTKLKNGETLIILPVSGTQYTIKNGDTVNSIAKNFKVPAGDITFYNGLTPDVALNAGDNIIIPDSGYDSTFDSPAPKPVTKPAPTVKKPTTPSTKPSGNTNTGKTAPMTADGLFTTTKNGTNPTPITVHPADLYGKINLGTQILRPVSIGSSVRTQGIHGFNAVDLGAKLGTPIMAAYDGVVLLSRTGGYNDGYGDYIIEESIINGNKIEFVYAHAAKLIVGTGATVTRGQIIGYVGETGDATGTHLHFEVRGAINPIGKNPSYTGDPI